MHELEKTWQRVLSVWWLVIWRATVGAGVIGFLVGFVAGFAAGALGFGYASGALGSVLGAISGLVWGIFVIRMALVKRYTDFRIALVPADQDEITSSRTEPRF